MVKVREAGPQDSDFLLRVLAIAADWQFGDEARSSADVLAAPDLAHYVPDLHARADRGVVAEDGLAGAVGAAWWRFFAPDDPGYGFVAADVPEVTVGVLPGHRRRGLATALMQQLIGLARTQRLRALSLSVEPSNFATHLYSRLGFVPVGTNGGAVTMLLTLQDT